MLQVHVQNRFQSGPCTLAPNVHIITQAWGRSEEGELVKKKDMLLK